MTDKQVFAHVEMKRRTHIQEILEKVTVLTELLRGILEGLQQAVCIKYLSEKIGIPVID